MSGLVRGTATSPAMFVNVRVPAGTRLEHVIIGRNTVLSPDAEIGAGVRFDARNLIPPGIDLTNTLSPFRWSGSENLLVVDLGRDVLRVPVRDILEALRLLPGQTGNDVDQTRTGELVLRAQGSGGMLLPVRVKQAATGTAAGTYVDGDGNIVFVTAEGHEVLLYPVLLEDAAFSRVLAEKGLTFSYDNLGRVRVEPPHGRFFYVGRAAAAALPASGKVQGLHATASGLTLVFEDENGALMEQELVPVPADWPALHSALMQLPGVTDVALDTEGVISVDVNGRRIRGRMSHQVSLTSADLPTPNVTLVWAGDLNGDGVDDYYVFYPGSSLVQTLFAYP